MWSSFVKKPEVAWMLYGQAKLWRTRPSKLLYIKDEYVAYCLDQAIGFFGLHIENEMEGVEGDTAEAIEYGRQQILDKYLPTAAPRQGQFADPAQMFK